MSFRDNLKAELLYQDILVKELAEKSGINKRTLDNYLREKANIPPADAAVKIAKALNVSVEYLVEGVDGNSGGSEAAELFSIYGELTLMGKRLPLDIAKVLVKNEVKARKSTMQ